MPVSSTNNKIYNFTVKLLFSTNHTSISTLISLFGLAGTNLSTYFKASLAQPKSDFFECSYLSHKTGVMRYSFIIIIFMEVLALIGDLDNLLSMPTLEAYKSCSERIFKTLSYGK